MSIGVRYRSSLELRPRCGVTKHTRCLQLRGAGVLGAALVPHFNGYNALNKNDREGPGHLSLSSGC